jgi:hypothetical protein
MRRIGDRRSAVRLEVVGALWGTLEVRKRARVVNLNRDGALLEYPIPVVPHTVHTIMVSRDGARVSLDVRVRHVQKASSHEGREVYLAGVEFVSDPEGFLALAEEGIEKSGNPQTP